MSTATYCALGTAALTVSAIMQWLESLTMDRSIISCVTFTITRGARGVRDGARGASAVLAILPRFSLTEFLRLIVRPSLVEGCELRRPCHGAWTCGPLTS